MAKVKVGVVGVGGIGSGIHLPAYAAIEDAEITAVCDVDANRLNKVAEDFGVPNTYTDYREMVKLKDLDAVTICTANCLHAPISIAALEAGKHVLCEKPLAMNAEEAEYMVDVAKRSGKILMVGVNQRFSDEATRLKRIIEAGELGEVYAATTSWIRRRGIPLWGNWFLEKAKSGGGPLIDIGVHALDLVWFLIGKPRTLSVTGSVYRKIENYHISEWNIKDPKLRAAMKAPNADRIYDVEDSAFAFIRFEGGVTVMMTVSWALNIEKESHNCSLYGTRAGAQLRPLVIYGEKDGALCDTTIKTDPNVVSHQEAVAHFVDCIKNGKDPISPGSDGVEVMKMLDAIYKSAEIGGEVRVR